MDGWMEVETCGAQRRVSAVDVRFRASNVNLIFFFLLQAAQSTVHVLGEPDTHIGRCCHTSRRVRGDELGAECE